MLYLRHWYVQLYGSVWVCVLQVNSSKIYVLHQQTVNAANALLVRLPLEAQQLVLVVFILENIPQGEGIQSVPSLELGLCQIGIGPVMRIARQVLTL